VNVPSDDPLSQEEEDEVFDMGRLAALLDSGADWSNLLTFKGAAVFAATVRGDLGLLKVRHHMLTLLS
jgi:hypothetical protein